MKTYRGTPGYPGRVIVEDERPGAVTIYPLYHHVKHSPDGFAWGYGGSGPAELARCIMLDLFGNDSHYQDFKWAFVSKWPQDKPFEITAGTIRLWMAGH